jgi:hypothetical protein
MDELKKSSLSSIPENYTVLKFNDEIDKKINDKSEIIREYLKFNDDIKNLNNKINELNNKIKNEIDKDVIKEYKIKIKKYKNKIKEIEDVLYNKNKIINRIYNGGKYLHILLIFIIIIIILLIILIYIQKLNFSKLNFIFKKID